VEALLRRAIGSGVPRLSRLTDLYTAVSVVHQLPLGGEDLSRYHGSSTSPSPVGSSPLSHQPIKQPSKDTAMLIHPWDAALDEKEWEQWVAGTDRFGILVVNNLDPAQAPLVLPTHVTGADGELLLHLARPNPAWKHLQAAAEVRLVVVGDYAYIPTYWRAKAGGPDEDGVPTSYYTSVQFVCQPTIVDDPQGKVHILTAQLADLQPEGGHADVATDTAPYGRMLSGIRGVRLHVLRVEAKFKYDDHNPVDHRERVIDRLHRRNQHQDAGAAVQQERRLTAIGDWQAHHRGLA
jgi:transcriptional regulator